MFGVAVASLIVFDIIFHMSSFESALPRIEQAPTKEELESPEVKGLFQEQFENPGAVEVYGGEMKIIDLKPEQLKTEVPAVFLRGWGTTPTSYKDALFDLAGKDRRTLAIEEYSGIDIENLPKDDPRMKNIPEGELRKVAAVLKTLDEKGIDQADLVAHSEGGIYATYAAMLRPEKVRSMVLVDPAGMMGDDSVWRTLKGAMLDSALQMGRLRKDAEAKRISDQGSKELFKFIAKDPKRAISSIGTIAGSQIHEILEQLHDMGIKISIIHGVDDKLFPMEKIQETTNTKMVDGFYSVKGTHNDISHHPEQFSVVIDNALDALENLSKKEKEATEVAA